MKRSVKLIGAATVAALALGTTAACSTTAEPDVIGLYYMAGPIDGNHFDHCWEPGTTTSYTWNNYAVFLPSSLRTWNISADGTGDSSQPIVVNAKPEEDQPSGVQVSLWTQTNFTLNTFCGEDNKDPNSPIVQFWERIGRRYGADTVDGWKIMLSNTIVTALETSSRSVAREYTADVLVSGTVREEAQNKIASLFQQEIKRVVGGEFFCSPTYVPGGECGAVQVLLKDVDYTNPAIQQARDEKQAAIERAAAMEAEAQGKLDAATVEQQLYDIPAWVELEKMRLQKEMVEACAANPNCTIVLGADGAIVGTRPQ